MPRQNNGPFDRAHWWKSSRSGGSGGACVMFTDGPLRSHGIIGVRDSKDRDAAGEMVGPILAFNGDAWRSFNAAVQAGQFDR